MLGRILCWLGWHLHPNSPTDSVARSKCVTGHNYRCARGCGTIVHVSETHQHAYNAERVCIYCGCDQSSVHPPTVPLDDETRRWLGRRPELRH